MPVVWYLYIFFICQLFVYLEAKMSTNWHFWRLLKMQTNSCIFVNKHHKNFLLGYFFIPYVYLNFDRKKNLEVHGMSRYLRHLQLIWSDNRPWYVGFYNIFWSWVEDWKKIQHFFTMVVEIPYFFFNPPLVTRKYCKIPKIMV